MSYMLWFGPYRMPQTPQKLTVKIKNKNKTLVLLNEGEINFLRAAGLTEITTTLVFPMYTADRGPDYYLGILESFKTSRQPFVFRLIRRSPEDRFLYGTDLRVSLEDYTITEDAKNGSDVSVNVSLKQWQDYRTRTVSIGDGGGAIVSRERDESTAPTTSEYTAKSGDTLWGIAKKYLGDGARYTEIMEVNRDTLSNPNIILPGQVIRIP